jgi:lipoprotein-anchoring transpeptidase ErfK/SrfK
LRRAIVIAAMSAVLLPALPAAAQENRTPLIGVNGFSTLVALEPGDSGPDVAALQQALADAGFYHHEVDGDYGAATTSAVIAFHKYLGLERRAAFAALDWIRLQLLPDPGLPVRADETDYLEIDLERQLLFLVRAGASPQVIPVSSGGGYPYVSPRTGNTALATTPVGDFQLIWHQLGWECDPVSGWCVYKYWAFTDYFGIHGYRSVPTTPASHGCVRVEVWDADWLEGHLAVGMPVHIWHQAPVIPPPPLPPDPAPAPPV